MPNDRWIKWKFWQVDGVSEVFWIHLFQLAGECNRGTFLRGYYMLGDQWTAHSGKEMLRSWIGWVQQGPEWHKSQ